MTLTTSHAAANVVAFAGQRDLHLLPGPVVGGFLLLNYLRHKMLKADFGDWLNAYAGTDLILLDFQADYRRSVRFRKRSFSDDKTPADVRLDLVQWGASSEAFDALKAASAEYQSFR